ncbi:MAG: beta-mannosidase, partial [Phenylobacterium sp.]|nr:beta-mannosidase [Phenylobacterium sp.]
MARPRAISGARDIPLDHSWTVALTPPGACAGPAQATALTDWVPASAPGTVAEALEAAGRWRRDVPASLHDRDAWWRLALEETGRRRL